MAIFLASQHINPSEDFTNPHPTFARPYQSYKAPHKYLPPVSLRVPFVASVPQ